MSGLLPCPQCGSLPFEHDPDWGGCTEYHGIADQSVSVTCSGENHTLCPVSVDISIDPDVLHDSGIGSDTIERIAVKAWNDLAKALTNS